MKMNKKLQLLVLGAALIAPTFGATEATAETPFSHAHNEIHRHYEKLGKLNHDAKECLSDAKESYQHLTNNGYEKSRDGLQYGQSYESATNGGNPIMSYHEARKFLLKRAETRHSTEVLMNK